VWGSSGICDGWWNFSLTPALSRREREPIFMFFKPEFDWIYQVDVWLENNAVSSLSLWERAGVRVASVNVAHQL